MKLIISKRKTKLCNAPIGLFMCGDTLCLKTGYIDDYGINEAYIVTSGERFYGGKLSSEEVKKTLVYPITIKQP